VGGTSNTVLVGERPPSWTRCFDVTRDDLPLTGDPATGRVQVRSSMTLKGSKIGINAHVGPVFLASAEVLDGVTGRTEIHLASPIPERGGGPHVKVFDGSIGAALGQTIRYVLTVLPARPQGSSATVNKVIVRAWDPEGRLIAESPVIAVQEGQTRWYDLDRNRLPQAGEPTTGRLQLRIEADAQSDSHPDLYLNVWINQVEVIDASTGKTAAYSNPRSFQIISAGKD
jgi:hypothetical protein